jgi:hypothetical protein
MRRRSFLLSFVLSCMEFGGFSLLSKKQKNGQEEKVEWRVNTKENNPPIDVWVWGFVEGLYDNVLAKRLDLENKKCGCILPLVLCDNGMFAMFDGGYYIHSKITHWCSCPKPIVVNKDVTKAPTDENVWIVTKEGSIKMAYLCSSTHCWVDKLDVVIENVCYWESISKKPKPPISKRHLPISEILPLNSIQT